MSIAAEELLEGGLEKLGFEPKGSLIDAFMIYIREIELWNGKVRLVSDPDPKTLVERHILDSLAPRSVIEELMEKTGDSIADVGAGGGFPGIPLALVYPELEVLLVERKTKKAAFLRSVSGILGLRERVGVLEGDVREVCRKFPMVMCRAFRPISEAYALVRPLLPKEGGWILIYGGTRRRIDEEIVPYGALPAPRIIPVEVPFLEEERNAVIFEVSGSQAGENERGGQKRRATKEKD